MWIKIDKQTPRTQLIQESIHRLECKEAITEAVEDLQVELFESGLVNEGTNRILEKLKAGLMKLCPSPDKLKEFFKKMGSKVDAKMQNCKVEAVKNAWNTLKGIVGAQEGLEEQIANGEDDVPEDDASDIETQKDNIQDDGENEDENEDEDIAAESLYDDWEDYGDYDDEDGYEDWYGYGDDEYEDEYEEDEYGKWYDYAYFEATGKIPVKSPATRKTPVKKP